MPPIQLRPTGQKSILCTTQDPSDVFVVSDIGELFAFDPARRSFRFIGALSCAMPLVLNSMAVRHDGIAFAVTVDGRLFRIDTKTASCELTAFDSAQVASERFGMGFIIDPSGPSETLYVTLTERRQGGPVTLGSISLDDFMLHRIGRVEPTLGPAELTGTGGGRLFAYAPMTETDPALLVELDHATARVIASTTLNLPRLAGEGFAVAHWGGQFWIFRGGADVVPPGESSPYRTVVWRFSPDDQSLAPVAETGVAEHGALIVGAGVSTCAPM